MGAREGYLFESGDNAVRVSLGSGSSLGGG